MKKYFCKNCDSEFDGAPKIQVEEAENEAISDELTLVERGQYTCHKCSATISEYRVFSKNE